MAEGEPSTEPELGTQWGGYPEPEPEITGNATGSLPEGEPEAATLTDPAIMRVMAGIAGTMSGAIIVENIIVLFVVLRVWPKQNPTLTYFIIHLACADLASGFQFLWFNCIDVYARVTRQGVWVLVLCGFWMVTIAASIGGIINFAHLRIHALKNAMKNQKFSKKRAIISITLSWVLPIAVLFLPPVAGWNCVGASNEDKIAGTKCSQAVYPFTKSYVALLVSLLFLSIVWMAVVYVWIYLLVHRRIHVVRGMTLQSKGKDTERELFKTMLLILSLFFICHFPVGVILIVDYTTTEQSAALIDAFQVILTISFLNALLNPLLYYWRMPATRDSFWLAFKQSHKTQNKQQLSSALVSKKSDKHSLSIIEIGGSNAGKDMKSTAI